MRKLLIAATALTFGCLMAPAASAHDNDSPFETDNPPDLWDRFIGGFEGEDENGRTIIDAPRWQISPDWELGLDRIVVAHPLDGDGYGARRPYQYENGKIDVGVHFIYRFGRTE